MPSPDPVYWLGETWAEQEDAAQMHNHLSDALATCGRAECHAEWRGAGCDWAAAANATAECRMNPPAWMAARRAGGDTAALCTLPSQTYRLLHGYFHTLDGGAILLRVPAGTGTHSPGHRHSVMIENAEMVKCEKAECEPVPL